MDKCLLLHAEHGFSASTFAARVVASTLSTCYCSISAAMGALYGSLHGGTGDGGKRAAHLSQCRFLFRGRLSYAGHRAHPFYAPVCCGTGGRLAGPHPGATGGQSTLSAQCPLQRQRAARVCPDREERRVYHGDAEDTEGKSKKDRSRTFHSAICATCNVKTRWKARSQIIGDPTFFNKVTDSAATN